MYVCACVQIQVNVKVHGYTNISVYTFVCLHYLFPRLFFHHVAVEREGIMWRRF